MCLRSAKATVSLAASRSGADGPGGRSTARRPRVVSGLLVALLAVPSTAVAQRDEFFSALVTFQKSLAGLYGDEGPALPAQLDAMSTALVRWDGEIRDAETQSRSRLQAADAQTKLQVHTLLASLYVERGRFADAVREFDEDLQIDPQRASFHRFKGQALQAMSRPAEAADAFRATWLLDPADPQNAYRLIAHRSAQTTPREIDRALETLANVERELIRRERPRASAPFTNVAGIIDDAGGAMAFVPAAYASGFAFILQGELDRGLTAFRGAIAGDPLVADPASRSEPMSRGIIALRQGLVAAAIEQFEAAVARASGSSEAHRILGTAYSIAGDIARSVQHLREAGRLNPRDERSWLALAHTLDEVGRSAEAEDVLRKAVAELPNSGALHWRLSTTAEKRQHGDDADLALIAQADRIVLLVGRGELYGALARLAQLHLDYEKAVRLLEQAVAITPNNAAAHKALGRADVENGRETEGYAELVIALLLDPDDVETLTNLGRLHLTAGRSARAVEALERAVGLAPTNGLAVHALADALLRAGRSDEGKQHLA